MNYRFKVRVNDGDVIITLRPGQSLSWGYSRPDDEGYSYASYSWKHEGDGVSMEYEGGGRDCDGAVCGYHSYFCAADKLSGTTWSYADDEPGGTSRYPDWQDIESEVYDEYAQAAGY